MRSDELRSIADSRFRAQINVDKCAKTCQNAPKSHALEGYKSNAINNLHIKQARWTGENGWVPIQAASQRTQTSPRNPRGLGGKRQSLPAFLPGGRPETIHNPQRKNN